jgi:uncharacterized YigZ family protein
METDVYRTILKKSPEVLHKDKNSKFYGYAFPLQHEDEVKVHLESLKKLHYAARHWCYAYQLGTDNIKFRANDDGEPNNSAGMPIYGQIQSFNVTNILIVVVRYFGGIKLGVGGLINAYRNAAQMALEESAIVERTINNKFLLKFDYKNMDKVMRIIKERNLTVLSQKLEMDCEIEISVRKKESDLVYQKFNGLFEVSISSL